MTKSKSSKKYKKLSQHIHTIKTTSTAEEQSISTPNKLDIESLTQESDFISYLEQLKSFSKEYTVLICVTDTPCGGTDFTPQIGAKFNAIGTRINLAGMYRRPYAAIIHKSELLYEKIGAPQTEVIEYETIIEGVSVKLKSAPFPISRDVPDLEYGITVNNLNYGGSRGVSFVVFDIENSDLIDFVNFDVFPYISIGNHYKYPQGERAKQIIAYKNAHPEVTVITYGDCRFPVINFSENEKFILDFKNGFYNMMSKLGTIPTLEKYFDNIEDIKEVITPPPSYYDIYGVRHFEDTEGRLVNTHGGIRVTIGQPQKYKRKLFIVGMCTTFGVCSADKDTIASHLQKMLNQYAPIEGIIVYNYGFYCGGDNVYDSSEMIKIINALPVTPGDIVLISLLIKHQAGIDAIDMVDISTRPHNYGEIFSDRHHFTQEGNFALADNIFKHFKTNKFYNDNYIAQTNVIAPPPQYLLPLPEVGLLSLYP